MKKQILFIVFTMFIISACTADLPSGAERDEPPLARLLGSDAATGHAVAESPRTFSFPADHGPHPAFRNEWWYLTGNLDSTAGRRFGFELTLFRFALVPAADARASESDWSTRQVYVGHLALTDPAAGRFIATERFARGAAGLAGARADPVAVWLYDWRIGQRRANGAGGAWQVAARDAASGIELALALEALKPPVLQGDAGLSKKSAAPGNASYYYSIPRLRATGTLALAGEQHAVSGLAWLDREWSSSALAADQQGWDWFALQLADGNELMFYQLRKQDGSRDRHSAGSWILPDGQSVPLDHEDVEIAVLDHWESPRGGRYPARWRIRVPGQLVDLRVRPVLAAQELDTLVRYWEGAVNVTGTHGAERVDGRGYVELTGYAGEPLTGRP